MRMLAIMRVSYFVSLHLLHIFLNILIKVICLFYQTRILTSFPSCPYFYLDYYALEFLIYVV